MIDGTQRRHYINGELAGTRVESAATTSNTNPLRFWSDWDYFHSPNGGIEEARIWNVSRTTEQIRAGLSQPITVAQPGLVGVWSFNSTAADVVGPHDGVLTAPLLFASQSWGACSPTTTQLCLHSRFQVRTRWRTNPAPGSITDGTAQRVPVSNPGSGLFWFFSDDNWELMVKVLNGCGLNNRYWVFRAATTNVFYRVEVADTVEDVQRIYFNYPGPPAPAVTDVNAFATCP